MDNPYTFFRSPIIKQKRVEKLKFTVGIPNLFSIQIVNNLLGFKCRKNSLDCFVLKLKVNSRFNSTVGIWNLT